MEVNGQIPSFKNLTAQVTLLRECGISLAFAKPNMLMPRNISSHWWPADRVCEGQLPWPFAFAFPSTGSRSPNGLRPISPFLLRVRVAFAAFAKACLAPASRTRPLVYEGQPSSPTISSTRTRDFLRVREKGHQTPATIVQNNPKWSQNTPESPGNPSNHTNQSHNITRTFSRTPITSKSWITPPFKLNEL